MSEDFREPDPLPALGDEVVGDDIGDFAGERNDTTLANELPGGLEGAPEPESPQGRDGMDE